MTSDKEIADIVVIGSGIGGLSCAALLARYGFKVIVCESHTIPGGAAHAFERHGFRFDSGPSLYSGLSYRPSPNPLRHVLDAIGEDIDWLTYDAWGCCLPEGDFSAQVGAEPFYEVLAKLRGPAAVAEWRSLQAVMEPLGKAAIAVPPAALRSDLGGLLTMAPYAPALLQQAFSVSKLTGPFSQVMDSVVSDPFIRNWLDLLCFMLSGLPASGTITAEIAFMFADWYRPGVVLDYPVGGSGALVNALLRGLESKGGELRLNAHVEQILIEGDTRRVGKAERAVGVRLRNGEVIRARRAVVSNAVLWDTLKLLPEGGLPKADWLKSQATPECDSFMHLHLGIDAAGLSPNLECHYIVVNDWERGVTAPQNVVAISIPSLLDPNLAPPGKHTIHVYTPATEPYQLWQGLDRRSEAYAAQKEARAEVMWKALERVIPDIRSRCQVTLVGTPLTHERFLRRHQGTYGPAVWAGQGILPGSKTPVLGLFCCGDSSFPGIGLPAVAASGMMAANAIAPLAKHRALLKELGF
ncbi:MAG: NAD(P)/FAD-dependent oxidoreductase [Aphanocapsa sp. GSE-SYN-MK-11-07L]|jgi:phytoene dehydrogenase-like protein|nr:NAD(P)/FAD-dependent oxidoreductase [Aphanocapsa sp. GSE-SYN-MK-11-07L]